MPAPTPSLKSSLTAYLHRGYKFMLIAWLGAVVNTACLYFFKGVLGIRIIPASILAIEIAILHNFIWYRYWAWRDRREENYQPFWPQFLKYNLATGSVDFLVAVPTLWALSTFLKIHYLAANLLAMILPPIIKFYLNEKHIFKTAKP